MNYRKNKKKIAKSFLALLFAAVIATTLVPSFPLQAEVADDTGIAAQGGDSTTGSDDAIVTDTQSVDSMADVDADAQGEDAATGIDADAQGGISTTGIDNAAQSRASAAGTDAAVQGGDSTPDAAVLSPDESGGLSAVGDGYYEYDYDYDYIYGYGLYLNAYYIDLVAGETYQLELDTYGFEQSEVIFSSSDDSIATVSATGLVTAVNGGSTGSGTVVITAQYTVSEDYTLTEMCTVTVSNTISLNQTYCTLYAGDKEKYQLTAVTAPSGTVTWSSSAPNIAAVDANGGVSPLSQGTATITATAGGVSASCEVTVKAATLSLKSKATAYVKVPYDLEAQAQPAATITWKSANTKIATVKNGVVTGKKTGTVKITATANGITKTCKVTIKKPSVSIYTGNMVLYKGSYAAMYASATPYDAIKWKSSKPGVASVDQSGLVVGKKTGTTKITATVGGVKDTCTVKVVKNPYKLNVTKRTLCIGESFSLSLKNAPDGCTVYFDSSENWLNVGLSSDGSTCTVTALAEGTATIGASFSIYTENGWANWSGTCTVKIVDTGISAQQFSLAKGKTKTLTVLKDGSSDSVQSVQWSSADPSVATVDGNGVVTAVKTGTTNISASAVFTDGQTATYRCTAKVSDPKFKKKTAVAAVGGNIKLSVQNANSYSQYTWKSSKKSVVTVGADGTLTGRKKGSATITATVDGKKITCKVYVSNPKLKTEYAAMAAGTKKTLSVKGLSSKSKVTYKSSNKKVASVSKKGVITAKANGQSVITVTADGKEFTYLAEVAPAAAINATQTGHAIMYSSSYSQALRMSTGYYDCSSLVFRAYGCNTGLLGGSPSWAPTAANMAVYMINTGKVLSYGYLDPSQLLPGDIIFYGGANNGRYQGIYHVSMYYGNGYRLENPLREYYDTGNIVLIARPIR